MAPRDDDTNLLYGAFLEKLAEQVENIQQTVKEVDRNIQTVVKGVDDKVDLVRIDVATLTTRVNALEKAISERSGWLKSTSEFLVQTKDVKVLQWIVLGLIAIATGAGGRKLFELLVSLSK